MVTFFNRIAQSTAAKVTLLTLVMIVVWCVTVALTLQRTGADAAFHVGFGFGIFMVILDLAYFFALKGQTTPRTDDLGLFE